MHLTQSYITLNGLRFHARHGVMPQENTVGGDFTVDLRADYDATNAMQTDSIDDAVDYSTLYNIIGEEMQKPAKLIEHVAYRIAQRTADTFGNITHLQITVRKDNPPMGADSRGTAITLHFDCPR